MNCGQKVIIRNSKLSIQHLWAATALVGVFIFICTHPIRPHDFWWHMAIGREILSTGQIPFVDQYSFTMPGQPYPSYQMYWLMEVALYLVYQVGGGELIILVHSILITGAYAIVLWLCYKASNSWRIAAFSTLFAASLGLNDWNVRPQAITFLLGAILILSISRLQEGKLRIWLLMIFLSMVVWVNSHGTFFIGLVLVTIWWLDDVWNLITRVNPPKEKIIQSTMGLLISFFACLLNPRGFGIINYLTTLTGNPVIQNLVPEWAPPSIETLGGRLFILCLMLLAVLLLISPQRLSLYQTIIFIVFTSLGLKTMRGAVWFGIITAPLFALILKSIINSIKQKNNQRHDYYGSRLLNSFFFIALALLVVISLPWFKQYLPLPVLKSGIYSSETPIQATDYLLDEKLPGPLFHDMSFGSYLIWKAQPDYRVFVDPRIELYDPTIWNDYIYASNGLSGWDFIMDKYGIQTIMASLDEQNGLISELNRSSLWQRVYSDQTAVIFTHR